ncbi:MAG: CxxxxCH/CxxCH domain-containing protein [Desulfuromonadales bacterium]|nr:CxxxxCH/CxxCH domain-containing protein [Desulfuromonadales bacterium]
MKSCRRLGWSNPRVIACLITLGIALFFGAEVQAAPQYDFNCDACHRLPPLDSGSGGREPATGAVKGNHQSHSGATGATCVMCHGSELTSTGHRDKTIQVQGNINGSPMGAAYTRGFVNQTSVPPNPLGSCSNVNCHFEAPSPTWGRLPNYVEPADCGQCHLMVPNSGNHPIGVTKHANYYGTDTGSCKLCHPDHKSEALPFRHATSATSRGIAVQFSALPNSGGTYSGNGLNFLPSQNKTVFGNCASLYCHSNGINGPPNTPAVWGGTLPSDCSGCHDGNANAARNIVTGTHAQHINNAALGTNYECARCHNTTVSVGNDLTITNFGSHVDGIKNVAFNNGGGYSNGICSGTLCHATGNASVPLATLPLWGGVALDCKGCHGVGTSYGEPNYGNGGANQPTANSHSANHVTSELSCYNCHANTTIDGVSIKSGSQIHTDGTNNVDISSTYALGVGLYNFGAKSCANTYCHSDGNNGTPLQTAVWGDAMPAKCVGCHGGDATVTSASSVINTFKHRSHMNNYSTLGRGNNLMCAECHAKTVGFANNTTLTNKANHINTFKDYSGIRAAGKANYNNSTTVCSNVYCHSSGEMIPVFRNMTGHKAWSGDAKMGCNGCHGYGPGVFTPVAGEPNYAIGNSHQKHTVGAGMLDSTGCAVCHRTSVDQGVANKLKNYSSTHLNGVREVNFAVIANYTGNYKANKTCSNTYCHGTAASVPWGTAGPLLCTDCHKASSLLPGHGKHWETATVATSYTALPGNLTGTATKYNFECSSCHNGAHANGPKGLNGAAVEVLFNYTAAGRKGIYSNLGATMAYDGTLQYATNGTCTTTYCHSKGDGTEGFGTLTMDWASPDKTLRCNGCHGGDISKAPTISTGQHLNHIDNSRGLGNGRRCGECHAKTMGFANNTTITDKTRHVNKFRDYSGLLAGGGASTYFPATMTCQNIYCHSNGRSGAVQSVDPPAAWTTGSTYGCNICHGQAAVPDFASDPTLGTPNYANAGAPGSNTSNSHKLHVQKMGLVSSNACYVCHARTMDKYNALKFRPYSTTHISGATHVAFGRISTAGFKLMSSVSKATYTPGAGNMTCSTIACHSDGKGKYLDVKWGASTNCALCHALNKLSRGHAFHIYTSAVNNPAFYDNYTANRSNSGVAPGRYNYGCANCHPVNNPNHMKGTVLIDLRPGVSGVGFLRSRNGASINAAGVAGTPGSGTTLGGGNTTLVCDNVYCHSNGYAGGGGLIYATAPDWYNGNFPAGVDRCANCHGNWPNSGIAGSPTHYNGTWLGTNQAGGHAMGIHADKIANSANFTGLATPGTSDMSSHGNASYSTTISCNTCHWATVRTSVNAGSSQCTSACHAMAANRASATIFDKSMHITGKVDVTFQTGLTVKSKAQLRDASFATVSSSTLWHRNGTYKAAGTGSYDSSKLPLSAGSYAGGNCSNVICHFNKPVNWDITPGSVSCQSCHQSL